MAELTSRIEVIKGNFVTIKNEDLIRHDLSVQKRNEAAIHLYSKMGFITEGLQERGAYLAEGIFLDVCLMGKLINK